MSINGEGGRSGVAASGEGGKRLEELSDMTGSYSEICEATSPLPDRPTELELGSSEGSCGRGAAAQLEFLSQLEGTVTHHGDLISFVADDLETKIKLSSPREESVSVSVMTGWSDFTGPVSELEAEAMRVAASVDCLTENLSEILHGISALTVDCLETYRDVVCKACDAVDLNIKSMYQLMAKCEELSKSMTPIYKLGAHIKNIKHLLDLLEAN